MNIELDRFVQVGHKITTPLKKKKGKKQSLCYKALQLDPYVQRCWEDLCLINLQQVSGNEASARAVQIYITRTVPA